MTLIRTIKLHIAGPSYWRKDKGTKTVEAGLWVWDSVFSRAVGNGKMGRKGVGGQWWIYKV